MARMENEDLRQNVGNRIKKDVKEKKYVGVKRLADGRIEWRAASNQS